MTSLPVRVGEARAFLNETAQLTGAAPATRITDALAELETTGTYWQSQEEVMWGGRLAWRNAISCMGRLYWSNLIVRDRRDASTPDEVAEGCIEHLTAATNGGKVRLVLTVFAPAVDEKHGVRIVNPQLIQYAGYRQPDGRIVGDPKNVRLTELACSLGWRGSNGQWDVLPLVIQDGDRRPQWYPLPREVVLEVPIVHPHETWWADLGLRWYAHPAISNQRLRIGGIDYPAAPFSAWYTVTEISARNLSDEDRYDLLPVIAERMGLDTRSTRTLWKDRALIALTEAVLYSYSEHGVVMVDHHHAAAAFAHHEERERTAGREVHGDWRSLVPPMAPSTTTIFHRTYTPTVVLPNFFPPEPTSWM